MVEEKTKVSSNNALDLVALIAQNLDQMNTQFIQTHNQVMTRLTNSERNQSTPRPPLVRQQKDAIGWKTRPQ
jgi:hypothetical protein